MVTVQQTLADPVILHTRPTHSTQAMHACTLTPLLPFTHCCALCSFFSLPSYIIKNCLILKKMTVYRKRSILKSFFLNKCMSLGQWLTRKTILKNKSNLDWIWQEFTRYKKGDNKCFLNGQLWAFLWVCVYIQNLYLHYTNQWPWLITVTTIIKTYMETIDVC